ncbi:PTS mannitol transporter subunit IICBA [Enterococcus sp. AZ126]|uniref:PTS mannitol transporter subunit IICBA n=1 Tax=Enterococcus sp. AZ126 TaxID=2774635 RepID=UPI003F22C224
MENTRQKVGIKVRVQKLGTSLSSMVMPNIGAFIAWGVLTAFFLETGWTPNKHLALMIGPMLTYLLPLLIGYSGGSLIYGQRGAVVGAIATMGVIVGADVPMFIGAMIMGPIGGWTIKKFDDIFADKIKTGFEMLVNNFSSGLLGFGLAILGNYAIGPIVSYLTELMGQGVEAIINMHLLPLANILIEPAKILFLNNAINHGILTPLGAEQAATAGKSILFLLETNPGPGLGVLLAFTIFGKGAAKSSAPGAMIIQFLGGIHEIYFPYVMMKPLLFLAVIAGGVSGTFVFTLLGAGLQAAASPGSILAILALTPQGAYFANIAGIVVATIVSFLVASIIIKADKKEEDLLASQAAVAEAKATAKNQTGHSSTVETKTDDLGNINKIIFACDAGMGSSAMGASILRNKAKKAGLKLPVSNSAINNLNDDSNALIVTQEELHDRAKQKAPSALFVSVENFMNSPRYDEIIDGLTDTEKTESAIVPAVSDDKASELIDYHNVNHLVVAYQDNKGSAYMASTILKKLLKDKSLDYPVTVVSIGELDDEMKSMIITLDKDTAAAEKQAPSAVHLSVKDLVVSEKYDELIEHLSKR